MYESEKGKCTRDVYVERVWRPFRKGPEGPSVSLFHCLFLYSPRIYPLALWSWTKIERKGERGRRVTTELTIPLCITYLRTGTNRQSLSTVFKDHSELLLFPFSCSLSLFSNPSFLIIRLLHFAGPKLLFNSGVSCWHFFILYHYKRRMYWTFPIDSRKSRLYFIRVSRKEWSMLSPLLLPINKRVISCE